MAGAWLGDGLLYLVGLALRYACVGKGLEERPEVGWC